MCGFIRKSCRACFNSRPKALTIFCMTVVAVLLLFVYYSERVVIQVSTTTETELFGHLNTASNNDTNVETLRLEMKQYTAGLKLDISIHSETSIAQSTVNPIVNRLSGTESASTLESTGTPISTTGESGEIRHIAFLKVHKAGSSTVQNILYRFGMARNLTFVLSGDTHYISKSKNNYNNLFPLIPGNPNGWTKYDILCNHVVFNREKFAELLYDDAMYFAIVREPLDLFISAAYYYRYIMPMGYLAQVPPDSFIQSLIHQFEKYEPSDLAETRTFNYMSRDFGMEIESFEHAKNITEEHFNTFLDEVSNAFKLVLLMERFDESLILLRRRLKWSIKDMLYIKGNVYNTTSANTTEGNAASIEQTFKISKSNLTDSDIKAFRERNWMDVKLYEFFSKRFDDQIKAEVNFTSEVHCFKEYLEDTRQFCAIVDNLNITNHIELGQSSCSEAFVVTPDDCVLMLQEEVTFYYDLIAKRKRKLGFV